MSNRSKFVELISTRLDLTKKDADNFLMAFVNITREHLLNEGEAVLPGFGRLLLKERDARKGHNPKTGEPIDIDAKIVVGFKSFPGVLDFPIDVIEVDSAQADLSFD